MSGASGLIYEILFSRILHLLMGSTVYSITTVLTAFMGGLALGAFVGGRKAGSLVHPVRAYALCELLIGLFALAVPVLLYLLHPLFRLLYAHAYATFLAWSLVSFVLCAAVLLPPTTLMGATLPILTEGLTRRGALVGRSAGKLYAVNTLGAFLGAGLAGFVLIPRLGQIATLLIGFAINMALFLTIVRRFPASSSAPGPAPAPQAEEPAVLVEAGIGRSTVVVVGMAYAASGFAAMLYQVGWTRATALSLGSSTYTFSIIVSAFIFGLAVGAAVMARYVDRLKRPLLVFAVMEIVVGISAAAVLPLFGRMPVYAYDLISRYKSSFAGLAAAEFGSLFLLISVPTLLMGALFPLSTRLLQSARLAGSGARTVGLTYAVNTIGTILGAFGMGFVLIPVIGVQSALLVASALNIAFGAAALLLPWPPTPVRGGIAVALLIAIVPVSRAVPRWDEWLMISGPYLLDPQFRQIAGLEQQGSEGLAKAKDRLVYFKDDPNMNVAVVQVGSGYSLKLNGKTDASTFQDMPTQRMAGHLPMLLHPSASEVCVIGMGSGVTGGCAAAHSSVTRLDQVEIARAVIEAGRFFASVNHNILENPRVNFIEADGRVHILFTPHKYDVIVSEPSNPWIAGIGNLFTSDYFRESKERLKPGGIMSAWVQTYRMSREAFIAVLRTFYSVFPDMTVWTASPGDLILVGSREGVTLDLDAIAKRIREPELQADMGPLLIEEPADLISHMVLTPADVQRITAEGTRINTDNNGWLEFNAPKALYLSENVLRASEAISATRIEDLAIRVEGSDEAKRRLAERLPEVFRAKRRAMEAEDAMETGDVLRTERLAREALSMNPREHHATMLLANVLTTETRILTDANRYDEALPKLEELARIYPTYPQLPYQLAETYLKTNRFADAMPWLDKLRTLAPKDPVVLYNRSLALLAAGRAADAAAGLEELLQETPDDTEALLALGNAYLAVKEYDKAIDAYDRATRLKSGYFEALFNRANALWGKGDRDGALLGFNELLQLGQNTGTVMMSLAALHLERRDAEAALSNLAPILASQPEMPQARYLRAEALLMAGRPQDALVDYQWLAGKQPRAVDVQLRLGDAYRLLGQQEAATAAYDAARRLDAGRTDAHLRELGAP